MHKVAYLTLRKANERTLEFWSWDHGEYSPGIPDIVEQLASMGYIVASPLDTGEHGNQYAPTSKESADYHAHMLSLFSPELKDAVDFSVEKYGYLAQSKLLQEAGADQLYSETEYGDTIFCSDLPDMLEITGITDDEADELALSLDPKFVSAARKIAHALEESRIDFSKVRDVESLP